MSRNLFIWVSLALWLAMMVTSLLALSAEPVGDGFMRGMNRMTGFMAWQLAAALLALVAWVASKPLPKGDMLRWLGRVPGWWCVAMLVTFIGLVLMAIFGPHG